MSCSQSPTTRRVFMAVARRYDLDESQATAVWHKTLARSYGSPDAPGNPVAWASVVDGESRAQIMSDMDDRTVNRHLAALNKSRLDPPDERRVNATVTYLDKAERARAALDRQTRAGAALRGVSWARYEERVHAYREQYKALPRDQRPSPPQEWVDGVTTRDRGAMSMPTDKATQWAYYRAQADPDAFPQPRRTIMSIDIETAGPPDKTGMEPENGQVIEVGISERDAATGEKVGYYSQLVKPEQSDYGMGAVHVHNITEDMVADQPAWNDVAPHVAARVNGSVILAQNAHYERRWLTHHLRGQGLDWRPSGTIDTLDVARQHFDLPNYKLGTICENVGVHYDTGGDAHRAGHDADVAADAWFSMRKRIHETYSADPARARLPQPPHGPPPRKRGIRWAPGDPVQPDPWQTKPAGTASTEGAAP